MNKITYENKEILTQDTSIANKNKVTADDMNEIKVVVNDLVDKVEEGGSMSEEIKNYVDSKFDSIINGDEEVY